jgi:flagellar biosynthetic protein FlhB
VAEESFQERTEEATGKRRTDARNKGQVVKSVDMNSAFMLLFGILLLFLSGGAIARGLSDAARELFSRAATYGASNDELRKLCSDVILRVLVSLAPVVGGLTIVGLASNFAQVGPLWTFTPLKPNFGKLNPLNGIKKVVISRRSMVELAKNVFKALIVGIIAYKALGSVIEECVNLMDGDALSMVSFMANASFAVGVKTGLAFLGLAALDFYYQRFEHSRNLRMTKEEVKEENKEMEGDPLVKGRIRTVQRKIAYKRMMQDVPKADVVLTNPTHLAVALKYDSANMSAPRVVAKGADLIAQRIKSIAVEHKIPIVEDKPLARALYHAVEVGEEIPERLFQAVAQVLAYIYRLRVKRPQVSLN